MKIELALVRKLRKVSAGRFRARWDETVRRKPVRVCRHAKGKEFSEGRIGPYHHLHR